MSSWVREDCDICEGYGTVWNPYMLEDEYCLACLEASQKAETDNLLAYATELAEEWVPNEWRGKDGWRIRRVQEKHGVRHLFED